MSGTSAETSSEASAKMASKNITELAEYVFHIHTTKTASGSTVFKSSMTILIISCLFVSITQNLISLCSLLKTFFCLLITWILIGVILHRLFTISLFYFTGSRIFAHSKYFVIILFHSIKIFS